jgi:hypothetical protein
VRPPHQDLARLVLGQPPVPPVLFELLHGTFSQTHQAASLENRVVLGHNDRTHAGLPTSPAMPGMMLLLFSSVSTDAIDSALWCLPHCPASTAQRSTPTDPTSLPWLMGSSVQARKPRQQKSLPEAERDQLTPARRGQTLSRYEPWNAPVIRRWPGDSSHHARRQDLTSAAASSQTSAASTGSMRAVTKRPIVSDASNLARCRTRLAAISPRAAA